jgi:RND family efflux transporter MFP subunit
MGPARVETALVLERPVAPQTRLVGTTRPRLRSVVAAEVAGLVFDLPVDVGDRVSKGQRLCKLRDDIRRFAHNEAVATAQRWQAVLEERRAELKKLEFEKERIAGLSEISMSTDKERSDTLADYDAAMRRITQVERDLQAHAATVDRLADELGRTEIVAPFDGYVVSKRTEVGTWVDQGGEVVELIDIATIRVRIQVPETVIQFCEIGAPCSVEIAALSKTFPAQIARVIPDADEQARTFPVEIDIKNRSGRLKAGMFARVSVPSGESAPQLVASKDAIVDRQGVPTVYVIQTGEKGPMAIPMPVRKGDELGEEIVVYSDALKAGAMLVTRGNERMMGPSPVILPPTAQAARAGQSQTTTAPAVASEAAGS